MTAVTNLVLCTCRLSLMSWILSCNLDLTTHCNTVVCTHHWANGLILKWPVSLTASRLISQWHLSMVVGGCCCPITHWHKQYKKMKVYVCVLSHPWLWKKLLDQRQLSAQGPLINRVLDGFRLVLLRGTVLNMLLYYNSKKNLSKRTQNICDAVRLSGIKRIFQFYSYLRDNSWGVVSKPLKKIRCFPLTNQNQRKTEW